MVANRHDEMAEQGAQMLLSGCAKNRFNKSKSLVTTKKSPSFTLQRDMVDLKRVNDFLRLLIVNH